MEFSRSEWVVISFSGGPSLEIFPDPGIEPHLVSSALAGRFFTTRAIWEAATMQGKTFADQPNVKASGFLRFFLDMHLPWCVGMSAPPHIAI